MSTIDYRGKSLIPRARHSLIAAPAIPLAAERLASLRTRLLLGVALVCSVVVTGAIPADAATSNTPVWIGSGFAGFYRSATLPGVHGGNQAAFDYYGPADTTVRIYAAPKNSAYNDQITAHITESGESSGNASLCGWRAVVEIRHRGNPIGRVQFSHLKAKATLGQISRWGGTVGKVGAPPKNSGASCYQVSTDAGRHVHIEFRSYGTRPACAHSWGTASIPATRYQGYLGDYGKAPIDKDGYVCPNGI